MVMFNQEKKFYLSSLALYFLVLYFTLLCKKLIRIINLFEV